MEPTPRRALRLRRIEDVEGLDALDPLLVRAVSGANLGDHGQILAGPGFPVGDGDAQPPGRDALSTLVGIALVLGELEEVVQAVQGGPRAGEDPDLAELEAAGVG